MTRFVNDPVVADFAAVGGVPRLIALRTQCGEAVAWAPGGDADALAAFLGESFVAFEGNVMQRREDGALLPIDWLGSECVVVKPPAGDVFVLPAAQLTQEWAIVEADVAAEPEVVDEPAAVLDGSDATFGPPPAYEDRTVSELVDELRARGLPVGGNKAEIVERLEKDDGGYAAWSKDELVETCRDRDLSVSGNKAELAERLATYDAEHPGF